MSDVLITGWGHSRFGKLADSLESLIIDVAGEAIAHAGLEPVDIDAVYLGQFNSGLLPLAFASSLALQLSDDLFGVPATRVENACASGSAAVHMGLHAIGSGAARNVLVVGAEKMSHASASLVASALQGADYDTAGRPSATGFAGLFAEVARHYEERFGPVGDTLGRIAAKNHRNGMHNPYAHLRRDLGEEFCSTTSERNPVVAGVLRRTDCSPVSDGAAALVLSREGSAAARTAAIRFAGIGHANDFLPGVKRDPLEFRAAKLAWNRAHTQAGTTLADLDLIELHDCFTIAELILYEAFGLADRGRGATVLEKGTVYRDGDLPVNISGGLKAKGHPVGATGVSQHVIAAMQLTGTAGDMQGPRSRYVAVHNMGGLAVANYVSILTSNAD